MCDELDSPVTKEKERDEMPSKNDLWTRKLFVGNIGYSETWKDVKQFFAKFGEVRFVHIVYEHITKRSRGIGFVEFAHARDADRCLMADPSELELNGRKLRVNHAQESKKMTFTLYSSPPTLETSYAEQANNSCLKCEASSAEDDKDLERLADRLPDDLWMVIFSYLSVRDLVRLERVCQWWRSIALKVWCSVRRIVCAGNFSFISPLKDKILTSILNRCGSSLRSLDLSGSCHLLTDYSLDIIGHYSPELEKLDMSGLAATNLALRNFSSCVKNLKWIRLQRCIHIGEKGLWYLFHHCKCLEYIDVSSSLAVTGKCFHMAGPQLKGIVLNDCINLTDFGIKTLSKRCPQLEELRIMACVKLTNKSIKALTERFSKLRILYASGMFWEATTDVWPQIGKLQNLVELNLDFNSLVTDAVMKSIATGCPNIRTLSFSMCRPCVTDEGVTALADLHHLTSLNMSYLDKVTDTSLFSLASQGQLEKLVAHACIEITDAGIIQVLENCPQLAFLDLSGNMQLTSYSLHSVHHAHRHADLQLQLIIGATSIVLEGVDTPDWVQVDWQNRSSYHLRPDYVLDLAQSYSDNDSEENWDAEPLAQPVIASRVDLCPDYDFYDVDDDGDDFLDEDDPLAAERWQMS